jgi:hypothetical protein
MIIDPSPVPGTTVSSTWATRCLFLGYKGTSSFPINSFPDILYFGTDYHRGQEIADEAGAAGYNLVLGFRGFEGSPLFRRAYEQKVLAET